MLVMLLSSLAENLIRAGVFSRALTFSMTGEMFGQILVWPPSAGCVSSSSP